MIVLFAHVKCDLVGCTRCGPQVASVDRHTWKLADYLDLAASNAARQEGWYVDARTTRCPDHWPGTGEEE